MCPNCGKKKGTNRSVEKARGQNQVRPESSNKLGYTCMVSRQPLDENNQLPINPFPGTRDVMNNAVTLNGKRHCLPVIKEYVLSEFKDVFEGVGKLP